VDESWVHIPPSGVSVVPRQPPAHYYTPVRRVSPGIAGLGKVPPMRFSLFSLAGALVGGYLGYKVMTPMFKRTLAVRGMKRHDRIAWVMVGFGGLLGAYAGVSIQKRLGR